MALGVLLKNRKIAHYINTYYWSRCILFLSGLGVRVRREEKLKKKQPYVFVANHTSFMDITHCFYGIRRNFTIVGKSSLNKVPLFGYMFKNTYIPVDRKSKIGRYRALQKMNESLKEGTSLALYPEGTIPEKENWPNMIKFQDGAFRVAIDNGVPVVPVCFPDNWRAFPDSGQHGAAPIWPRMIFHKAIETKGMTQDDAEALRDKVFDIIDKSIKKHNKL